MFNKINDANYEVDENGVVRHSLTKIVLNPSINKSGYAYVNVYLKSTGKQTIRYIHRLVWEAFNGAIPSDKEIDHIDNNKLNNCLSNLQLVTHQENCIKRGGFFKDHFDELHPRSRKVIAYDEKGNVIGIYKSTMDVERRLGIHHSKVTKICNGIQNKTRNGVTFKYVE